MSLRIPNDFVSGFEDLINLSIDKVKEIATVISTIPPGTGPGNFESSLCSSFSEFDVSKLSSVIFSFGNILLGSEESNEVLSKMLCKALLKNSKFDEEQIKKSRLEEKLNIILQNADNIKSTYKAIDLMSDNHINYKKGRVFSDIRLLFEDDFDANIENRKAVVIHRLKLECNKDDEDRSYYFSLDSKDLIKMKELIDRAIIKEEKIKSDYSNIEFIEITD